jgi:hypothetical protein
MKVKLRSSKTEIPVLAEGRAHRRCGVGFAGLEGQLDHGYDFLGHRLDGGDTHPEGCGRERPLEGEPVRFPAGGTSDRTPQGVR